jgi:hypothetical protein
MYIITDEDKKELDRFKVAQNNRIQSLSKYLKDENIVITKDMAFDWILELGKNYNNVYHPNSLMSLIDNLMAYALAGKECSK